MDTNFKQWQALWQQESEDIPLLESHSLRLKGSHSYIDKIRRNMRQEFYAGAVFLVFCIFYLVRQNLSDEKALVYYSGFGSISVIALMYVRRFYKFYKASGIPAYHTRASLLWFVSEMRLMLEVYRSLTYIMLLCGLFFGFVWGVFEDETEPLALSPAEGITLSIILFLGALVVTLVVLEAWIYLMYGRYVRDLQARIQEFSDL
jgi:hypothetical protein